MEVNINEIEKENLKFIPNVILEKEKLPDLEFVRYILDGGDFEALLQAASTLQDSHRTDDDYLGNLLRNLQLAKLAKMETCCRQHAKDPVSYTDEHRIRDITAIENRFSDFKQVLMDKST